MRVFAVFPVLCELDSSEVRLDLKAVAKKKTAKNFFVTFLKGIGCNWMVCMAVFLQGQAQDMTGKVIAIYLPISTFVMCGFEHIPANFYLCILGLMANENDVTFADVLLKNWIPVTLGNFFAGAFIVAGGYSFIFGRLGNRNTPETATAVAEAARRSMGFNKQPTQDVEKGSLNSATAPSVKDEEAAPGAKPDDIDVAMNPEAGA